MQDQPGKSKRIAVIGGGISGLAAAHRAVELDPAADVVLLEASSRLGGILQTVRRDGFLIETSADSFITSVPAAVDLCRRIGFADQLISTSAAHRGAMVVCRGRLEPVPSGFLLMTPERLGPVLRSPILSLRGKLRLAMERFVKPRASVGDESLASFARRRFGNEVFERLVQPLIGGIYTADPEKLSLGATLPRFLDMERQYGSLRRATKKGSGSKVQGSAQHVSRDAEARRSGACDDKSAIHCDETTADSGARYSMFVAPRDGLSSLVEAIAARLPPACVRLNSPVEEIQRLGGRWRLSGAEFDAVIIATPAGGAARLLRTVDASLADDLAAIQCAGTAIVVLGYDRDKIAHPLNSFGFVVPAIEKRRILSASFSSVKFPGRAPEGKVLIRVFLGGALQPEMLELDDGSLQQIAEEELSDLLSIGGSPSVSRVFRWPRAMPQYHLGHLERWQRINDRVSQLPGLALAGNAHDGVGIPQCIRSGERAAEKVIGVQHQQQESPGMAIPGL